MKTYDKETIDLKIAALEGLIEEQREAFRRDIESMRARIQDLKIKREFVDARSPYDLSRRLLRRRGGGRDV